MSSDMSVDVFKTIIDWALSSLLVKPVTKLFGLGEPLLNPHISSMVQYAKKKGLEVGIVSNFTLVSRDISEKFIEAQLDSMCVSLDAASPEVFRKIRVGAELDEVIGNVELFLRIRKDMNSTKPQIFFNSTINRNNVKEIPAIVKLARNVGVDGVNFANQIVPGTKRYEYPLFETLRFGKSHGEADVWVQEKASICPALRRCYVTFDGKVMPCNFLMEIIPREKYQKFEFGDITKNSFRSIWFSNRYQQFRIRKTLGFHPYFCHSCPCLNSIAKRKTYSLTI